MPLTGQLSFSTVPRLFPWFVISALGTEQVTGQVNLQENTALHER
jgi:hypothetical protein